MKDNFKFSTHVGKLKSWVRWNILPASYSLKIMNGLMLCLRYRHETRHSKVFEWDIAKFSKELYVTVNNER